ncbi:MAG: B12-binding domain-containing radical SAM protein [Chloroflexi bacterium GWB2_49_20]|nr:MAG: B12-binding domain-containing radical SAM protein [Chloroflexi bacterium GWB2_49_20]OGN77459.1 MAG: B12-binding domain-containing radical SAM protein [Chloroflexi bacterium GWC2_49_37]OGN84837.1 MAG: B12-binding domain-containing radical SAM protein [Chloroflexi bacterium GWD2_49_16]HCC79240.1 B12-binding domain-containing radical SAM protein [Anaerolineae bacterium]
MKANPLKILFVYPEFPDTFWSFKHALKFIRKKTASPPLGLLTVAAMLPSDWEKRLVDLNLNSLSEEDLKWADYVFVSAMIVQRESAHAVINRCKLAGVKVVAGGPLFTMEHEQFPEVDYFVLNEAEETLGPFLIDLERGETQRIYASTEYPDIHQTPAPLWQLANLKHYQTVSIQVSRGCPFNCDFCNVTALLGHNPRTKTAAQIITELDNLYALGWRKGIFFVDDNFIGNKKHIKSEVLPALINWRKGKTGMPFSTEASINLADDPVLLKLMVQAGFDTVFVGIETPNEDSLTECSKNQNKNRDLVESVKQLQRAGLQVQGGFIVGFDNDPLSIFQQQIDFIQKSGIVTAMVGLLQAPLGTRLYERMHKEGRLVNEFSGDNVDGSTNIIPRMGLETLREGYRKILNQIYAPEFYYKRVLTFLQEYKPPRIKVRFEMQYFLALLRSIYQLGIRGVERVQYWQLFFWTLFRRPRLFPLAITFAISGFHFRQVIEMHVA